MMHFFKGLFSVLFVCAVWVLTAVSPVCALSVDVKEFTLENGMLFLVVERHTTPQVACRLSIRAGSALEDSGNTGIAHMLEHMMFKGTMNFGTTDPELDRDLQRRIEATYQAILHEELSRKPDRELIRQKREEMERLRQQVQKIYVPQAFSSQLEKNGAVGVNAFTSQDETQYMASIPSDMLDQWFSIVSEQIFEPAWREFYVEKEVVQREWAFRYVNSPSGAAWLDLFSTAYSAHPYGNPVIGWRSDMKYYNTTDAKKFHETFYNPSNAVCVLVGDVRLEAAKRFAEIYFGRYPRGFRSPEKVTAEPAQEGPRRSIRYLKGARSPLVRMGFHGALMGSDDFYALDALTMVLSHGRSARLTREIVQKGRAMEAWAYNPDQRYGGLVILGGSPHDASGAGVDSGDGSDLEACRRLESLLLDEVDKLVEEPVSEEELTRVQKLNERDFLDRLRSNESLAHTLASLEVKTGWRYLNEYIERISRVTPEDIQRVAAEYLRRDNMTTVFVLPGGAPEKPPEPYEEIRSSVGMERIEKPEPSELVRNNSRYPTPEGWKHPLSFERDPDVIKYPEADRMKTAGAEVFFLEDRELPLVDLTLLVKAGKVDIPKEKTGLDDVLSGSLIQGGTRRLGPDRLAEKLDDLAMDLSVSVGEESTVVRLSVLKDHWEEGMALLAEIITSPGFEPGVVDAVKRRVVTALARRGEDARAVAMREALIWHFQGHPYGRDPLLALETVPEISGGDLQDFLSTYFVPSNMVTAVAGDISAQEVERSLQDFFSRLDGGPAPARRTPEPEKSPPVLCFIDKPGQLQAQVVMMLPGIPRTDPDYWKLGLLVDLFGGGDSILYTRLREDLGLVYAAYAHQASRWKAGMVVGYAGCRADSTVEMLGETAGLMAGLHRDVPSGRLETKRLDLLNSFVFNVDSPRRLVTVYGRYYLRGEPLDTLDRIQRDYLSATAEELEGLACEILDPSKLQVFVVADGNTPTTGEHGKESTLRGALELYAGKIGLPFLEMELR
ncbi:MAG: pitrilysin family protein [Desulfatiglandaceae bacterium]